MARKNYKNDRFSGEPCRQVYREARVVVQPPRGHRPASGVRPQSRDRQDDQPREAGGPKQALPGPRDTGSTEQN